jgi:ribonuclease D
MTVILHKGDLPSELDLGSVIAVDTETMGLNPARDRLCLVQLSAGDGRCHLVKIPRIDPGKTHPAPNLARLLADGGVLKIFHYARFDLVAIRTWLGVDCKPVYCTKIAAKLVRTFTDRHGLKDLCKEILGVELSKQQQSSDWGAEEITPEQQKYAANDVLYLHQLKAKLDHALAREGRSELAASCFAFLPTRAELDRQGWAEPDLFTH